MTAQPVVVIGGGFGGLALAIRLQSSGIQTVLLERRDKPGGRAYVFEDQGFTFDAGPTVITAPGCIEDLFQLSGRSMNDYIRMQQLDPFYRLCWEDGSEFQYNGNIDAINQQIAERNPDDVEGYARFLDYSRAVFAEGYEKLADVPFLSIWSMVKAGPNLIRLESYRSVYSLVSRYISDPQLRQAFSYHTLLVGGNPFSASAIYALIHALELKWGVWFPQGGTGALVASLARLFQDLGGELRLSAGVDRIRTRNGRVTGVVLSEGNEIPARAVASNADVVHTYQRLLRDEPRVSAYARRLARSRHSMSLFLVYFGLKRKHPGLAHHTVLFGPRYRELLEDIFERGNLADDFSLYLHSPSVTDDSLAPEGCSTYYALAPVPHLGKADIQWNRRGEEYRDRILDYLEQRCLPGLRQDMVTCRIFTPRDFATELNAHHGSAFSLEPVLTQSAWFRVHNRDRRIRGLYFVGAGTHPGAGIPGVVNSASATAGLMQKDLSN